MHNNTNSWSIERCTSTAHESFYVQQQQMKYQQQYHLQIKKKVHLREWHSLAFRLLVVNCLTRSFCSEKNENKIVFFSFIKLSSLNRIFVFDWKKKVIDCNNKKRHSFTVQFACVLTIISNYGATKSNCPIFSLQFMNLM